ncbi:MAG: hypothetical protein WCL28_03520 [bacterium]
MWRVALVQRSWLDDVRIALTKIGFVVCFRVKEDAVEFSGLQASAILLLLFGRSFKFRGQAMDSLFPMLKSSNDGVCRIARAMNDLQEARNRAAHRGTVLEKDNMKELRDLSAALLNDLDHHFSTAS